MPTAARADTRLTYDDFLLFPDDGKRHEIKRRLFERTGVREYWLVDPELDLVQELRPNADKKLTRVDELGAEDDATLTTPLLPGWQLSMRTFFAEPA